MYDMKEMKKLGALGKNVPEAMKGFQAMTGASMGEGEIPVKYKELIAVAVGISKQCPYCIEIHKKAAIAAGATEKELAEAVFIAATIGAGAAVTHGTHLIGE